MIDEVTMKRLRDAYQKRREAYQNEDPEISFKMACREINMVSPDSRKQARKQLTELVEPIVLGRAQARGRKSWLDDVEDRHEEIHGEFQKPA